jgi:tetratricopeptide (TPR) repeat protein
MFLFLALALGLGFVLFGIGAGGIGLGNLAEGGAGSGVPSVSDAEERVLENPRDAEGFEELATAHQTVGNLDEAIDAMQNYVRLRPKDADGLRELAALYLQKSSDAQERAEAYSYRSAYLAPGSVRGSIFVLDGTPLVPDPITNAVSVAYEGKIALASEEARSASAQAVEQYKLLAELEPDDPTVQLEVAQAAQSAGDAATTIAAYEAFLKLAPDDPTAPEVRRILKQLKQFSPAGS